MLCVLYVFRLYLHSSKLEMKANRPGSKGAEAFLKDLGHLGLTKPFGRNVSRVTGIARGKRGAGFYILELSNK